MIDANAKVGADSCSCIGPHGAEDRGDKALPFTEFVRSHDLWLPSTFACHSGQIGTWKHHSGKWVRNDFVGLPTSWPLVDCSSWVSDDIDVALQHEDHRAALVSLKMRITRAATSVRPRPIKYPIVNADLELLRAAPGCSPALDVHTHAMELQQQVVSCLPSSRHKYDPKPVKPTLSPHTWELVQQKRQLRNALHEASRLQQQTLLHMTFAAWQRASSQESIDPQTQNQFAHLLADQDRVIAKAIHSFRLFRRLVVQASRSDDIEYFQAALKEGSHFLAPSQAKDLWRVIKKALPKYRQRRMNLDPLRLLNLEDACNPHFETLEAGQTVSPAELIDGAACRHVEQCGCDPPTLISRHSHFI